MAFTNAQLAQKMAQLIEHWQGFSVEYANWLAGSANGGTNGDGRYPLTDWTGAAYQVESPARLAANVNDLISGAAGHEQTASGHAATATSQADIAIAQANLAAAARIAAQQAQVLSEAARDAAVDARVVAVAQSNNAVNAAQQTASDLSIVTAAKDETLVARDEAVQAAIDAATFDPALYAPIAHSHNYLPLSGGSLAGSLSLHGELNYTGNASFYLDNETADQDMYLRVTNGAGSLQVVAAGIGAASETYFQARHNGAHKFRTLIGGTRTYGRDTGVGFDLEFDTNNNGYIDLWSDTPDDVMYIRNLSHGGEIYLQTELDNGSRYSGLSVRNTGTASYGELYHNGTWRGAAQSYGFAVNGEMRVQGSITGNKATITQNGESVKLQNTVTGTSNYIGLYRNTGNTRTGYIGHASSTNDHLYIVADLANIQLTATNGDVLCTSKFVCTNQLDITGLIDTDSAVQAASYYRTGQAYTGAYGLYGTGSSSNWAQTIWGMSTSFDGGAPGAGWNATALYGLAWVRGSHADTNSRIGEGFYVYQNGSLKGGIGSSGGFVSGALEVNGRVYFDDISGPYIRSSGTGAVRGTTAYNSEGGATFRTDGGQLQLYQTSISGGLEDLWVQCIRNGGVALRYNNSQKFITTSTGGTLTGQLASTTFNATSARRHKTAIKPLQFDVIALLDDPNILPQQYQWKREYEGWVAGTHYGFIADDVLKSEPHKGSLVALNANGDVSGINYINVIAILWKQNQLQEQRIKHLEARR
ncbi:tail fiber domain-containing protein [Microbulbifer discodermiae]|uniref:tail fiber domain-containing protein n=1 Tax=Microbulbifer sp. 2201CG32-9 TaxID=3232309 RepID=UPI00345B6721